MTQALVVVLGQPCAMLHEATRLGAPLAACTAIALRQLPHDVQAVSDMAVPSAFRLAWIFVNEPALDSHALRACQQRLGRAAPVTIATYHAQGNPAQPPAGLRFPGGVIFQPYTDATFPLVLTLIRDFAATNATKVPGRLV